MTSDELREHLFDAVARGAGEELSRFAQANLDAILTAFPTWTNVPVAVRQDAAAVQRYANGLIQVARLFEQLGHPELLALLRGDRRDNPIERWQTGMFLVQELAAEGRHAEVIEQLEPMLAEMVGSRGTAIDMLRPKMYGALGAAHFRLGHLDKAYDATQAALDECKRLGDAEGVRIYRGNLAAIETARRSGN